MFLVNATGHIIEIDEHFYSTTHYYGIEEVEFADGTVWNRDQLFEQAWIRGTGGADSLQGFSSDDTFYGGAGDDTIYSTSGSDTFVYASGDGNDKIDEENGSTSFVDRLELTDLNVADVSVSQVGNDLMISINATGHTIEVDEHFYSTTRNYGIEELAFADGTIWDRAAIIAETSAAQAAMAQAAMTLPLSGLWTLAGPSLAGLSVEASEAAEPGLSLTDLLEDSGWRETAGVDAQIVSLLEVQSGLQAPSGEAAPDAELTALAIFNTMQVMPEFAAEGYAFTQ